MWTMTRAILLTSLLVACKTEPASMDANPPDDASLDGGADADAIPTCTVTATTALEALTNIVTGSGEIRCDAEADLSIRVCLYSKAVAETVWSDLIECRESSANGLTRLKQELTTRVAAPSRHYRTVVEAQIDGERQPAQTSATITAP